MKNSFLAILLFFFSGHALAEMDLSEVQVKKRFLGIIEGSKFDEFKTVQNLTPFQRTRLDLAELEAEFEIRLNDKSKIEFEAEVEHGGTGTAMEFDNFEEFGEFETETEKGGEVNIDEFFYQRRLADGLDLYVGKAPLYISLTSIADSPLDYPSVSPSLLEGRMIPVGWKEIGLQLHYRLGDFTFRAAYVAGLNSEYFRTYNWVGGGYQRQFEGVNADDMSTNLGIEWGDVQQGRGLGVAMYQGSSGTNRYKKDKLNAPATVRLGSVMGAWRDYGFFLRGQALQGSLSDSEAVTLANTQLGGLANPVNFASLGSKARLESLQVGYEFPADWTIFYQKEHVNTFADAEGVIDKDPRYDVTQEGGGLMKKWDDICFVKLHYYKEATQLDGLPVTQNIRLQFGFDTGEF